MSKPPAELALRPQVIYCCPPLGEEAPVGTAVPALGPAAHIIVDIWVKTPLSGSLEHMRGLDHDKKDIVAN